MYVRLGLAGRIIGPTTATNISSFCNKTRKKPPGEYARFPWSILCLYHATISQDQRSAHALHLDNAPARDGQMELDRVEVRSSLLVQCNVTCIVPKKSDREDPSGRPDRGHDSTGFASSCSCALNNWL
jgi:hypothetical protein